MTRKMPRGAMPVRRSDLAVAEPYRLEAGPKTFVPSGVFPTPNHELATAVPYRPGNTTSESFISWPTKIGQWPNETLSDSNWAEEAFAKACVEPRVMIPSDLLRLTAQRCGTSNLASFLQTEGFPIAGKAYLNGPYQSVDWTDPTTLNEAIASVGPVKIIIDLVGLTPDTLSPSPVRTSLHCASLFGYGPGPLLADLFEQQGRRSDFVWGESAGLCYAIFLAGSVGTIYRQSLLERTGEAWVRNPTTVVRDINALPTK